MIELKNSISETTIAATKTTIEDAIDAGFNAVESEIPTSMRIDILLDVIASRSAGGTRKFDFQTTFNAYGATPVSAVAKTNFGAVLTEWEDTITDSGMYNSVDSVVGGIVVRPGDFISTIVTWGENSNNTYTGKMTDCLIYKAGADTGYNGVYIAVGCGNASDKVNRTVIQFDIKDDLDALGATAIVSANLYLNVDTMAGIHSVRAFRVLLDWGEAAVTWNTANSPSLLWNTAGVEAADDSGIEDSIYDRKETPESLDSTHVLDSYSTILDLTSLAREWLAGTSSEYGVLLQSTNENISNWVRWHQREDPDGERPYLQIEYTV